MTKKILLLVLMVLLQLSVSAQIWTIYNTQNSNILGNTVLAVTVDSRGNKWVGTNEGMCKLAGKAWTDYSMFNEKLKGQYVNCLTVDSDDMLWIGTDDHGMILFDGIHWEEHSADTKRLNMKFVRDIAIDARGEKWIGVTLGGFVHFDGKKWKKYTHKDSGLLSDFVLCVAIDKDDMKWIGTNEGLSVFDGTTWYNYTPKNSKLPSENIPSVVVDKRNVKWIATLGGLCRHDGRTWEVYTTHNSPLPSNQVNDLALDNNGILWIATTKGLAAFDGKNWVIYNKENTGLPIEDIKIIAIDKKNNRWLGTDFSGLISFSGFTIQGKMVDESGNAMPNQKLKIGTADVYTDDNGVYRTEVVGGSNVVVTPEVDGVFFDPPSISISKINSMQLNSDFVAKRQTIAAKEEAPKSTTTSTPASVSKVVVTPYLEQGYITISFNGDVAEVEIKSDTKVMRTIPNYKRGNKINISKFPRGTYKITVRTSQWEKTVTLNKKH